MFTTDEQQKKQSETMKKVTKLGSKWNNSANAGAFYWNLNNASSNRNRNISRQLVNARNTPPLSGGVFYISVFPESRATWQNIKTNRLVLVGFESSLSILEDSS